MHRLRERFPSVPFVLPFAVFIALLGLRTAFGLPSVIEYPIRAGLVAVVLLVVSRPILAWKPVRPLQTILIGTTVFVIWISPDILWPSYRSHWLFQNSLLGTVQSTIPSAEQSNIFFLVFRVLGTAVLVPIIEELFWRAWLMRYLINADFRAVSLGAYSAGSFWFTAALFASEHGPFWDVGFIAGVAYNWWMTRTKNISDCILAHAVTNALLAVYVLRFHQWQYWL